MRQAVSPERMFRFLEDVSAPVNWPRIQATNVSQIERTNDIESLTSFLADCAVGDADDGFIDFDSRAEKVALKHLQLSIQYLLHSREALRHRQRTLSQGSRRLSRREENAKKRLMRRKSQANILKAELERQNDALSTYHTILQARDPDLAARLTRDNQGRVVVAAEDNCNIDLRASVGIEEDDGGETTTTSAEDSDDSSSLYSSLSSSDEDSQPRSQADDDDDPRDGVVLLLNPHRPHKKLSLI